MVNTLDADLVVIGSGAAGAAFAGELARRGISVKVLEPGQTTTSSGGHFRNPSPMDAGMPEAGSLSEWHYRSYNGDAQFGGRLPGLSVIESLGRLVTAWSNNAPTHHVSSPPAPEPATVWRKFQ